MEFMLVTAILPTRGRPQMAQDALDCILKQEWREMEILVLDDADRPSFSEPPDAVDLYSRGSWDPLSRKLNAACSLASGEYIVHFHDDDRSSPERILDQVTRLEQSQKAVTIYKNLRFTDGKRVWINHNWLGGYGMSLCHRKDWWEQHPFPEVLESEDWWFVTESIRAKQFIHGEAGDKMLLQIHSGNAHYRQIGEGWEEISAGGVIEFL